MLSACSGAPTYLVDKPAPDSASVETDASESAEVVAQEAAPPAPDVVTSADSGAPIDSGGPLDASQDAWPCRPPFESLCPDGPWWDTYIPTPPCWWWLTDDAGADAGYVCPEYCTGGPCP